MEGSIVFYTYGSTLELYGQQFTAGMLTANLLNLSPDEYRPMSKRMKQITSLVEEYERKRDIALWWKLNEELAALCGVLRRYAECCAATRCSACCWTRARTLSSLSYER